MRGTPSLRRNRTTSRKPVHDNEACVLFAGKVRGTTVPLEAGGEGKVGRGRRARARTSRSKRRVTLSEFRRGQNIFDTPHAKNFRLTMFAYKKRWKTPVLAVPCGGCDCVSVVSRGSPPWGLQMACSEEGASIMRTDTSGAITSAGPREQHSSKFKKAICRDVSCVGGGVPLSTRGHCVCCSTLLSARSPSHASVREVFQHDRSCQTLHRI